jgi:hypothetical protein
MFLSGALAVIGGLTSRLVDRSSDGEFIFWKPAFVPDGVNYFNKALELRGVPDNKRLEIARNIFDLPQNMPLRNSIEMRDTLSARPIYPWLTSMLPNIDSILAPLLVPIFFWFLTCLCVYLIGRRFSGALCGFLLVILFSSSFYSKYNLLSTTPDGLAFFFMYLGLWLLLYEEPSLLRSILCSLSLLAATFCRPIDPILLVLIGSMFVFNLRKKFPGELITQYALPFFCISIHFLFISLNLNQLKIGGMNTASSEEDSPLGFVVNALMNTPKIMFVEFGFVITRDPVMFFTIFVALILVAKQSKREMYLAFGTVVMSAFFLASLNGTIGNGFRYQMPIYGLALLILSKEMAHFRMFRVGKL